VPYIVWEESGGAKQQQNEVRVCEIVFDQYLQMYNSNSTMQDFAARTEGRHTRQSNNHSDQTGHVPLRFSKP